MPRLSNQKQKLAFIYRILNEYTDASHPMTMKQIIQELAAGGIPAERKSVYDDIETLRLLDTDVKMSRGKTTGYYIGNRDFELSELKLLVDAVHASKFIPEAQSKSLIKKLTLLASAHDRPSLNRQVFVSHRAKNTDGDIFKTVDCIHEAIERDRAIKFSYFSWTVHKKKELRRNGRHYSISPWALVWDDSCYYLIGFDNEKSEIRHFRVDKMISAQITDSPRLGKEEFESFDLDSYSEAVFGMFGGKPERVTLSCAARLANVILDRFGSDTVILNDGESFRISVNIIPSPVFLGWVLSFGGEIKVLSPEHIRKELDELRNS